MLVSPSIAADTLRGLVEGDQNRPLAIPLSEIQQIAVRDHDLLKTAGLVVGILLLVGGLLFALAFGQGLWEWYGEIAETED